jgi:hypothetical protein
MSAEDIREGTPVRVPVWAAGEVTGWADGTVTEVFVPRPTPGVAAGEFDTSYLVTLANGDTFRYFRWSLERR